MYLDNLSENKDLDSDDVEFIRQAYSEIIAQFDNLTQLIERNANEFTALRMPRSDYAILLLSAYELKFRSDIPISVSVNEAVELAKRYSTEKSGRYVNGVLSGILKDEQ